MELLFFLIKAAGTILWLGSAVLIVIMAFHDDILWGLVCVFGLGIPPILLIYIISHFEDTKYLFLAYLAGASLLIIGNATPPVGG
ncbi:MAG: hypothetical protein H3C63_12950 [Candidatus Omnitrophica bacterium]|jgi:hypothetical protein|nr:hypothetical protein [Candidatus Omnitrophota bacterium]MDX9753942.1 hypothetical protein [bacterium]